MSDLVISDLGNASVSITGDTDRVLQGTAATITRTLLDQNGAASGAAGALTVGVTRADGTVLVAAGTATTGSNPYSFTLTPAQTATLDRLTVTWTDAGDTSVHTSYVEIVGGYYLTIPQIRVLKNLDDTDVFTDTKLTAARRWFEDKFEQATGVAWVPRYRRVRVDGPWGSGLVLPDPRVRTVRSVRTYSSATTYVDLTAGELADLTLADTGLVSRPSGYFTAGVSNLVVGYEHGYDAPPADVKQAALVAIRDYLLTDNSGNRVYSVQTQDGIVRSSTPGSDHPFGLPFVDEVVRARSHLFSGAA